MYVQLVQPHPVINIVACWFHQWAFVLAHSRKRINVVLDRLIMKEKEVEREKDSVSVCGGGGEYKDIKRLVREDEEGENNASTSHHSHTSIRRLGLIDGLMRWNWRWQQLKVSLGRRRWRRCFVW